MLGKTDLRALSRWCVGRDLSWTPGRPEDGAEVMMLQPRDARYPWQRIMVVLESPEIRIENELGETLASASDLPALLDAVDGGVGESWDLRSVPARLGP